MNKPYAFWAIFIFLVILFLVPIWNSEFLPFVDYPQHLCIASMLHNYHTNTLYSKYFIINLFPKAHIIHTLILHGLNYFMPIEIAGKVLISLYVILLPLSVLLFIQSFGGDRWYSIFSFIFIYNYSLMWGFLGYVVGLPLFFVALSYIMNYNAKSGDIGTKKSLSMAILFILAILSHGLIYIILLSVFFIAVLYTKHLKTGKYKAVLIAIPSILFFILCVSPLMQNGGTQSMLSGNINKYIPSAQLIMSRMRSLVFALTTGLPFHKKSFFVFIILAACIIIYGLIKKALRLDGQMKIILTFATLVGVIYAAFPHIDQAAFVGERLSILIPFLIIGILSRVKLNAKVIIRVIIIAIVSIMSVFIVFDITTAFGKFNKVAKPVRKLLSNTRENGELVELYYGGTFRSHIPYSVFLHFACYYQIWKNGLAASVFPDWNSWHVLERRGDVRRLKINVWGASRSIFPNRWHQYDYFLVCGKPRSYEKKYYKQLKLVNRKGIWALYKNPLNNN